MEDRSVFSDEKLERVIGGIVGVTAASLTEEEVRRITEGLGEGQDMGSWKTMSREQYEAWRRLHPDEKPIP